MLARDPRNDVAANNLAMLLVTHRTDGASLERASKLTARFAESSNPAFLDTYGWVLYARASMRLRFRLCRRPSRSRHRHRNSGITSAWRS